MDLLIMGLNDATEYIPIKPTYAPRIFSSFSPDMAEDFPLINSKNYMAIRDYVFDDNDSSYEAGPVWINGDIAKKIIQEYQKYQEKTECLLVHCTQGKNRSPTVAMVFNDVFNLGYSSQELKEKYNAFNRHTYKTLMDSA